MMQSVACINFMPTDRPVFVSPGAPGILGFAAVVVTLQGRFYGKIF